MDVLHLTQELVACPSITPADAGAQRILADQLCQAGFTCLNLPFGQVSNLWATHGQGQPVIVFAGHTDVVPPGPESSWTSPPFTATIRNGRLYGRGVADMKASDAAFTLALKQYVLDHPHHPGTLAALVTSDEEGAAIDGTAAVMGYLDEHGIKIDYCVVAEPSSEVHLGDTIKNGRRGSLSGKLTLLGKQGHIAYPHLADNPIHRLAPILVALTQKQWDSGNAYFPPTSFQISNIHGGTGVGNVIPGDVQVDFNFRFSTEQTPESLQAGIEEILQKSGVQYTLQWSLSGLPFITGEGELLKAAKHAVEKMVGMTPKLSTSGGTSDGRFIAPYGAQVIELGPVNASIHQQDENLPLEQIEALPKIYYELIHQLLKP